MEFWLSVTEVGGELPITPVIGLKNMTSMSLKPMDRVMGFNRLHCKVDTKQALKQGVMTGLFRGTVIGVGGAMMDTAAFPLIGTVTGGVSSFMAGFAQGFIQGTVSNVATQLLASCFS
ncbi:hypothetical protein DU508_09980 [Pedobacter chinensis]|uniref:Uncharacterized protein n=1 Tax=Pedobacter chinensis TaxID=2282421 RepID=A0A369Q595_9SPHI|nr:hypothetical protein [Pedobacter chinensis]RDC57468.1 hypothetical protein DU508_09980 [Pedobacter chinensis]